MKKRQNNIRTVLPHPRYEGGRNKFVNYVWRGRAVSSFSVIAILSAISYGEKSKRCGWYGPLSLLTMASTISGPCGWCAATSAETFSFPVQSSLFPLPPSRRFRTRIDTPGDQIRPGGGGGKSKERFHERGTPFVKTTPACRFVISCLITACTRTVVSPPFASDPRAYLLSAISGGCEFVKIEKG